MSWTSLGVAASLAWIGWGLGGLTDAARASARWGMYAGARLAKANFR